MKLYRTLRSLVRHRQETAGMKQLRWEIGRLKQQLDDKDALIAQRDATIREYRDYTVPKLQSELDVKVHECELLAQSHEREMTIIRGDIAVHNERVVGHNREGRI